MMHTLLSRKSAVLFPFLVAIAFLVATWFAVSLARPAAAQEDEAASASQNGRGEATAKTHPPVNSSTNAISEPAPGAISTGLIGYWPFDDGTDPTVDASGNGHDGALAGNPLYTTDVPAAIGGGTALDFDGGGDYVTVGGDEGNFDLAIMTVALWLNVDEFDRVYQAIITKGDDAWRIHRSQSTNYIEFVTSSGLTNDTLVGTVDMLDGNWHHIAAVYDGTQKYLYIDGVLDNFKPYSSVVNSNDYPVLIGDNGEVQGRYFDGQIDDVRIYSRALSAADVAQLYAHQPDKCFVEATGDNITDHATVDASALRAAAGAAAPGATLKIAGTCTGAVLFNSITQTLYITKSLTLQGGYTVTNWLAASDPVAYPTMLDAQGLGRVVYVAPGLEVTLDALIVTGGQLATGHGAGIYNSTGTLTVTNSIISGNSTTGNGGAIFTQDNCTLTLINSTLSHNTATLSGGGILSNDFCTLTIVNSTLHHNTTSDWGGAIYMDNNSNVVMVNSTMSANAANRAGGAYADDAGVTGVFSYTTVVSNTAASGGGGLDLYAGSTEMVGTIVAYNQSNGTPNNFAYSGGASLISLGYNLDDLNNVNLTAGGDLVNTDPLLGPLADNSGNTPTHALLAASPALDQVPNGSSGCGVAVSSDQRGVGRPQNSNCDIGAYEARFFTLTITPGGNGSGTVLGSGIDCGADCSEAVVEDSSVTLSAGADTGSTFDGWTGACSGVGNCAVTMDAARSVTATFTLDQYELSVGLNGTGTGSVSSDPAGIDCDPDCVATFDYGTVVTLDPSSDPGSTFSGWTGACSGTGNCEVTVDAAKSVTATFTLDQHDLAVTLDGTGSGSVSSNPAGIDCEPDCAETYDYGTVVTLTASADIESTFAGWTGACSGLGDCEVTVDTARSVTATFALNQYDLDLSVTGNASGAVTSDPAGIYCPVDCTEPYPYGTVVTLTALYDSDMSALVWGGACSAASGDTCMTTVEQLTEVSAAITLNQYGLGVSVMGNGSGGVSSAPAGINCQNGAGQCTAAYDHGTSVTLSASADSGSTFTGWSGACSGTSACVVTMDAAKNVTANFTLEQYGLTVTVGGTGSGVVTSDPTGIDCGADCSELFDHSTSVTLTAMADADSTFAGWSGACTGTGACVVTMDMAHSATATFVVPEQPLFFSYMPLLIRP